MSSCNAVPTLTSTNEVTSQSLLTTVSGSTVTSPPTTTTIITTIDSAVTTITSVVPGQTSTISVTLTSTVPFTTTQTTTLFGTTCSAITVPPTSTPSSTNTEITTTPSPSSIVVTSLSTAPNGSVVTSTQTITASTSPRPTVIAPPATNDNDKNLAAIIGGSVGGGVGLIVLILLAWFIVKQRRRRSKWDDVFSNEEMLSKPTPGANIELVEPEAIPEPYPYTAASQPPTNHQRQPSQRAYENAQAGAGGVGYGPGYFNRHPSARPGQVMDYPSQGYYQGGYGPQPQPPQTNGSGAGAGMAAAAATSHLPNPYDQHPYPDYNNTYGRHGAPFDYNPYADTSGRPPPTFPFPAAMPLPETATPGERSGHSESNTSAGSPNSAAALQPPRRDVKGGGSAHGSQTSLNARPPVVHTDAGRYQGPGVEADGRSGTGEGEGEGGERAEETSGRGHGPAPPAYSAA